jgi:hypothetical protein
MISEKKWGSSLTGMLRTGLLVTATAAPLAAALAQTTAPLPPVIINPEAAANATVDAPNPSGPPIPKAGTETVRPLQSAPSRIQEPFPQVQAAAPQPLTIGE